VVAYRAALEEGEAESLNSFVQLVGAILALTKRDECVPKVVHRGRPVQRHALSGALEEGEAESLNCLLQLFRSALAISKQPKCIPKSF
jgi:hypothetical protein